MSFDNKVPVKLKEIQSWFGSIIGRAIDVNNKINPITPSGNTIVEEAKNYIAPSPTLTPDRRIEIYNQQYWWRLLVTMQEIFPLVVRLFGYTGFNLSLVMPYLEKYPPTHWSLSYLGEKFPLWIEEEYSEKDKEFIYHAAKIDRAYNNAFLAPSYPLLEENNLAEITSIKLILQPNIHLFSLPYDLLDFRSQLLKNDVEYWIEHDFPELDKNKGFFFVVFRTKDHNVAYEKITKAAFLLLCLFEKGASIDEVCTYLDEQNEDISQEAFEHLSSWFQKWTVRQWLAPVKLPT